MPFPNHLQRWSDRHNDIMARIARLPYHIRPQHHALVESLTPPPLMPHPRRHLSSRASVGEQVSALVRADRNNDLDTDETVEALNAAQDARFSRAIEVIENLDGFDSGQIRLCGCCSEVWVDADDAAHSDTYDALVCAGCADDHVYADDGNSFVHPDNHSDLYSAYTRAGRGGPSSEQYFTDDTDLVSLVDGYDCSYATRDVVDSLGWFCNDDGEYGPDVYPEYDDDDYDDSPRRAEYHSSSARCRSFFAEPFGSSQRNIPIGMELEIYSEGTPRDVLDSEGLNWLVERDGSLDDRYGYELISPPTLRSRWEQILPSLLPALVCDESQGYTAPNGQYGIHLTVARKYLGELGAVRAMLFLRSSQNAPFVRAVAQRQQIYSGYDVGIGTYHSDNRATTACGGVFAKKVNGTGKMSPLNLKRDKYGVELAEFRIFQSTLKPDRVMKNLEFVWALTAWLRDASGTSWDHRDFVAWLARPANRKLYPHLVDYLKRPEYGVKGGPRIITTRDSVCPDRAWPSLLTTKHTARKAA